MDLQIRNYDTDDVKRAKQEIKDRMKNQRDAFLKGQPRDIVRLDVSKDAYEIQDDGSIEKL